MVVLFKEDTPLTNQETKKRLIRLLVCPIRVNKIKFCCSSYFSLRYESARSDPVGFSFK